MLHELILGLLDSFVLGLGTPLTALCVLPLYPGFLAYIANTDESLSQTKIAILVASGVISFMLLVGIVITAFLQASLTGFVGIAGPIAYGVMLALGFNLLVNGVGFRTGLTSIPRRVHIRLIFQPHSAPMQPGLHRVFLRRLVPELNGERPNNSS